MRQPNRNARGNQGFTMIELVVVLILLVIFSKVALSTYNMTITNKLMAEMDGLKVSLRFAQIQALNDDTATWGIRFPDATTYRLYKNNADASSMIPVKGTAGDPETVACPKNCHKLQGNVQITSGVGTTVTFDKWGRPVDGSGNPLTADITNIALTQSTESKSINVTKNTGFIP